jgi:hypothetical protein
MIVEFLVHVVHVDMVRIRLRTAATNGAIVHPLDVI